MFDNSIPRINNNSNSRLEILFINVSDTGAGGTIVPYSIMKEMQKKIDVSLLVDNKKTSDSTVFPMSKIQWLIKCALIRIGISSQLLSKILIILKALYHPKIVYIHLKGGVPLKCFNTKNILTKYLNNSLSLIHCHNLQWYYFDLDYLIELSNKFPVVLTLHDAWMLTGSCMHFFNCTLWREGCTQCPEHIPLLKQRRKAAHNNWVKKRELYAKCNLYIITPCQWLMNAVNESILSQAIIQSKVIPNGVNQDIFQPMDKTEAKSKLNLPTDRLVLLFSAGNLKSNIFKDYNTLILAIKQLKNLNHKVLCIAIGDSGNPEIVNDDVEIQYVPFVSEREIVALYSQAADIYLHPARAETFPTSILEAVSCGTPVIATDVGGIPETVIEGETGYLVPVGDDIAFADRITKLINDDNLRKKMSDNAYNYAKRNFNLEVVSKQHIEFYEEIVNDWKTRKNTTYTQ